ncbi:MAG: 5'/3'-nucleotidase SurE, partial [Fibrobacterota bacterium]
TPDLVISGFNPGENAGISSFYSGTVAGAREGTFFGIRSLSLSLSLFDPSHYAYALQWLDRFLARIVDHSIDFDPRRTYLNINFPHCAVKDIKGTRVTRQGTAPFNDDFEERVNPSGKKYYWLFGDKTLSDDCCYDEKAVRCAYVTVTPLTIDMTDNVFYEKYASNATFV